MTAQHGFGQFSCRPVPPALPVPALPSLSRLRAPGRLPVPLPLFCEWRSLWVVSPAGCCSSALMFTPPPKRYGRVSQAAALGRTRVSTSRSPPPGPAQRSRWPIYIPRPSRLKCFRSVKASGRQCHCSLSCRWSPGACLQCVHRYIYKACTYRGSMGIGQRGVAWSPLVTSRRFGGGTRACRWSLSWSDHHRQSGRESVSPACC